MRYVDMNKKQRAMYNRLAQRKRREKMKKGEAELVFSLSFKENDLAIIVLALRDLVARFEPITPLDFTTQKQIKALFNRLEEKL